MQYYATPLTDIALQTFGIGGPAVVLIQLMLIGVVSWLLMYIVNAAGQGTIGSMIKVAATFICIGIITATAWKTVLAVAKIAGLY